MPEPIIEILDPLPHPKQPSKWRKYGPLLLWGTIVVVPAMNMTTSYFDYKTAQLAVELEKLKQVTETMAE